jgi:hypothetical protein
MKKVLILGCGPAGLIAAHAAATLGANFIVYSKKRKSYMNGAQYLHAPIPDMSISQPFEISYQLSGEVDGYRQKVYGDANVEVSPESLVGRHEAWDIREAYDNLWDTYRDAVVDELITPELLSHLQRWWKPDLVISTIPATILCSNGQHKFQSEMVWSTDTSEVYLRDNTVLCNGEEKFPWYRASLIQGHANTEWPYHAYPSQYDGKIWRVQKPISTTCNCFQTIHRMGRYGKWTKGVLSHQAWDESYKLIEALLNKKDEPLHDISLNTTQP